MRELKKIIADCTKKDFILSIIETNKDIEEETIWEIYNTELTELNMDAQDLQNMLKEIQRDGYIMKGQKGYRLTSQGQNFEGYIKSNWETTKATKKQKRIDQWWKTIPIIISIVVGTFAIYNGCHKSKEKVSGNKQTVMIAK